MTRALALLAACAVLTGCYTVRFHRRVEAEPTPASSKWHHSIINGAAEVSGSVKVSEICPNGFAVVENQVTFLNGLANFGVQAVQGAAWYLSFRDPNAVNQAFDKEGSAILAGLLQNYIQVYSPSTVTVTCAKDGAPGLAFTGSTALKPREEAPPPTPTPTPTPGPTAPKKKGMKIAVTKLVAKAGVDPATADLFTDALVGELRKSPNVNIISPSDISALLGFDKQKQLLGCTEASCLAEIGGALGVERLISGTIGRIGNSLVVYMTSMDPRSTRTVTSVSERLKSNSDEAFLDSLPRFAYQLLNEPK